MQAQTTDGHYNATEKVDATKVWMPPRCECNCATYITLVKVEDVGYAMECIVTELY